MKKIHYSNLNNYYTNLNSFLKGKYGEKVLRICIDGGFTCPNRDGTCGKGGCIFCNERGAGEYLDGSNSIARQVYDACQKMEKTRNAQKFIAYFQNFTGTHGSVECLESKYNQALIDNRIVALAIATRPDCISQEIIDLLTKIRNEKGIDIWIELGLQTIHDKTADLINRCYKTQLFYDIVDRLRSNGIDIVVHLMMGLPGETREDMLASIVKVSTLDIQGIKFHNVNIMKNTKLADMFFSGKYKPLELAEYISILAEGVALLPPHVVIHRLVSDCNPDYLIAPNWASDKFLMLTEITKKFVTDNVYQGRDYKHHQ